MKKHMLIFFSCRWVGTKSDVVRLGRGRFRWHKQASVFFYYIDFSSSFWVTSSETNYQAP
jgi:hypothetical protein